MGQVENVRWSWGPMLVLLLGTWMYMYVQMTLIVYNIGMQIFIGRVYIGKDMDKQD